MNSSDPQNEIILSICLIGRNDDYGKDFKRRLRQSVNFLAYSAEKAGVLNKIEVLLTDWNSDVPLAEAVNFSPAASGMVKFIEVPPAVAKQHNYGNTPFHTTKAINIGLRRASGRYVGMMPGDILISAFTLERLIKLLDGQLSVPFDPSATLLGIPRKFIPHYGEEKKFFKDNYDIERILVLNDFYLKEDMYPKGLMGGYGVLIMARELCFKVKGFDENLGGWGPSDVELALRLSCSNPLINLSGFGIASYDFEPDKKMVSEKNVRLSDWSKPVTSIENNINWGLGNETFTITPARSGDTPSVAENNLISPDQLLDKNFRYKLLLESRKVPCSDMSFISPEAIIMANIASQLYPKKVLHIGSDDVSQGIAVSLFSPLSELFFVNIAENNLFTFGRTGSALFYSKHVGNVCYFPFSIEKIMAAKFGQGDEENTKFDLISIKLSVIESELRPTINQLSNFASPRCTWLFNYTGRKQLTELTDYFKTAFPEKKIVHSITYKLIVAADFNQDAVLNDEDAIDRAWQPFPGNMFSKLFCNLELRKEKILKVLPVLFRQKLRAWPQTIQVVYSALLKI